MTLMATSLSGFGSGAASNPKFIDVLTDNSLTTNLEMCLDAGDASSYTSGQSWLDVSGNDIDFFRGADGSAASDDPTFNGSGYFSADGGDFFRHDTGNAAWMTALHRDNAVYSGAAWIYHDTGHSSQHLFFAATWGNQSNEGIAWTMGTTDKSQITVANGSGSSWAFDQASVSTMGTGWHFVGLSINEAGGGVSFHYVDGTDDAAFDAAYTSPGTGNATNTYEIWGAGGATLAPSGARMAVFAFWEGTALTAANFDTIYAATKGRFGL